MHEYHISSIMRAAALAAGIAVLAIASLLSGVGDVELGRASPLAQATMTPPSSPLESRCVLTTSMQAASERVDLGASVGVTLALRHACPPVTIPMHLVFVMDASGSLAASLGDYEQLTAPIQDLIRSLDGMPQLRIGVVAFNTTAQTVCPIDADLEAVAACLDGIEPGGNTAVERGLLEGLEALRGARQLAPGAQLSELMVLVSDGQNNEGCESAIQSARQVKEQGVLLVTICASDDCDTQCMQELASSARYAYSLDELDRMRVEVIERSLSETKSVFARHATILLSLGDQLTLVPDSPRPAATVSADARTLSWNNDAPSLHPPTVTLRLRAKVLGLHPVAELARAELRDSENLRTGVDFTIPQIEVVAPATATPDVEASPEPASHRLWLPWVLQHVAHGSVMSRGR